MTSKNNNIFMMSLILEEKEKRGKRQVEARENRCGRDGEENWKRGGRKVARSNQPWRVAKDNKFVLLVSLDHWRDRRKEKERMKPVPKRYILFTRHDKIFYFYRPTNKIFYLLVMLQIDGLVLNVCICHRLPLCHRHTEYLSLAVSVGSAQKGFGLGFSGSRRHLVSRVCICRRSEKCSRSETAWIRGFQSYFYKGI